MNTGATLNGRALAQTAVTLDSNAVTASGTTTAAIVKVTGDGWIVSPITPAPKNNKATFVFTANLVLGLYGVILSTSTMSAA